MYVYNMLYLCRRNARISIKQTEGEIMNEKKSRKAYETMIDSVQEEIKRLQQEKSISFLAAEKVKRHLKLIGLSV